MKKPNPDSFGTYLQTVQKLGKKHPGVDHAADRKEEAKRLHKSGALFSLDQWKRNQEALRLLDAGEVDQEKFMDAIQQIVLDEGEKGNTGTLLWCLYESGEWDGAYGADLIKVLAVCGNYEVRDHCFRLLGWS